MDLNLIMPSRSCVFAAFSCVFILLIQPKMASITISKFFPTFLGLHIFFITFIGEGERRVFVPGFLASWLV